MPTPQSTHRFRLRFSLRQLFLLVALVAVGIAVGKWVFRKEAVVRAATAEDKVFADESLASQRNAAVVTGHFMRSTSLMVSLHVVQAGMVEHLPGRVFGRDVASKGRFWEDVKLWLYLTDGPGAGLRMIWNAKGDTEAWEQWFKPVKDLGQVVAKQTLPGTIIPDRPHIVYVEGDQQINVDGKMTVEEFAKANPGNYIVVAVEIR